MSSEQQPALDSFRELGPEQVLDAVEVAGVRCNPVCWPLNSFENRVYDVQLESGEHVVAKFYRPQRWTAAQILEEHTFLADLERAEVPVCGVRAFPDGSTLRTTPQGILYCIYDRKGGRAPDEVTPELLERLGMLVARIHNVGEQRSAPERWQLGATSMIRQPLLWFETNNTVPPPIWRQYQHVALELAGLADKALASVPMFRVHGDFHLGNLLLREGVLHVLDFDDMLNGPAVQDAWMIVGRGGAERAAFEEGYRRFRDFDSGQWALAEILRGLRMVHYSAWLAKRWHDPIFPATWPHFGTIDYWAQELEALHGARSLAGRSDAEPVGDRPRAEPTEELSNKDFFWDLED